jgi:predicted small metal-binding protein
VKRSIRIPRGADGGAIRQLRPALTADEQTDIDDVYRHAVTRNMKLVGRHPVRVVVRCNQLGPDFAPCEWSERFETTAATADEQGRTKIAEHLRKAHPYLTQHGRRDVMNATWTNIRDIG